MKEQFGDGAEWAGPEAARAWVTPPEGGVWTVQSCTKQELVVQRGDERSVLKMAVHACTASGDSSGTVINMDTYVRALVCLRQARVRGRGSASMQFGTPHGSTRYGQSTAGRRVGVGSTISYTVP